MGLNSGNKVESSADLFPRDLDDKFLARIFSKKEVAKDTWEIIFSVEGGEGKKFQPIAGQYIWVEIPTLKYADQRGNRRAFSNILSSEEKSQAGILFRSSTSGYKRTLQDLPIGSVVNIFGPKGFSFSLTNENVLEEKNLVLIGGGVGIAPFLSIIRDLEKKKSNKRVVLFSCNDSSEKAPYQKELKDISNGNSNLETVFVFGKLSRLEIEKVVESIDLGSVFWFVSGKQGFVDSTFDILVSLGIDAEKIHFEQFYPKKNRDFDRMEEILRYAFETAITGDQQNTFGLKPTGSFLGNKEKAAVKLFPFLILFGIAISIFSFFDFLSHGILNLETKAYLAVSLLASLAPITWYLFKRYFLTIRIFLFLVSLVLLYSVWTGGINGTGIYWIYFFPALAFILGKKDITKRWIIGFGFVLFLMSISGVFPLENKPFYPSIEIGQALLSFIVVSVLTYVLLNIFFKEEQINSIENTRMKVFKQSIDDSTGHTVITNLSGVVVYANSAAQRITGYSLSEMLGQTPRLWGGYMSRDVYYDLWQSKLSGRPFFGEVINRRKNGEFYYALGRISPIKDNEGKIIGFVGNEEDITDLKFTQLRLKLGEERWSFALEGARDGVWDWNVQTNRVFFSKRWKEMLGYNEDEIENNLDEWSKRTNPEDLKKAEIEIDRHFKGLIPYYESEQRIKCKDGSYKWILDRGKVVSWTKDGKPLRMVGTHTDITEIKENEEKLKKVSERFELATSSAKIGIWEWDIGRGSVKWDERMFSIYGIKQEVFLNDYKSWESLVYEEDRERVNKEVNDALEGAKYETVFRILWPDKSTKYIRSFAILQKNKDGKPAKMVGVSFDVTRDMELDKERNEFISLASHQLRTPLTGIRWVVERITKTEKMSRKAKEYIKDIQDSSSRLSSLVESLLNASRINTGKIEIKPQEFDLASFLTGFLKEYKPLSDRKKIRLSLTKTKKQLKVKTDVNAFRNIIQSLVDNAINYTPEKGKVDVSFDSNNTSFVFKIKDTGIGIPKSEQARIFEKFGRASNAKLFKTDGTGLGLFIAAEATKLLGGKIWFESEENKGTTFFVELPLISQEKKGEKGFL